MSVSGTLYPRERKKDMDDDRNIYIGIDTKGFTFTDFPKRCIDCCWFKDDIRRCNITYYYPGHRIDPDKGKPEYCPLYRIRRPKLHNFLLKIIRVFV